MSIKSYFDQELNKVCFLVRVVRKSKIKSHVRVEKRVHKIESKSEAEKTQKKLNLQAERELFELEAKNASWGNLVNEWADAIHKSDIFTRKLAFGTAKDYLTVLSDYTSDWTKLSVDDIDKAKTWGLLDRIEKEVSIARRKKLRTAIDSVFNWALLSGRIQIPGDLPTQGFKSTQREEEKLPEILNLEQSKALLMYAKTLDHPWYPAWALALYTGMRSGELYALEWQHIDFEKKLIYVHRNWTNKDGFGPTKGRYWRMVPLGDGLVSFLKELKLKRGKEQFVLQHFQAWKDGRQAEILRQFCVGSGVPSVRFHTLRACFATLLIADGIAPAVVMKMGGWKDLKTMQRYIRMAGIEVKGATDGLKLFPEVDAMGRVVSLLNSGISA